MRKPATASVSVRTHLAKLREKEGILIEILGYVYGNDCSVLTQTPSNEMK